MAWSTQGMTSTVFRDSSVPEVHDTSQTPTLQFVEVPRVVERDSFTVKSVCVLFS
jgi:hypothetical protein